MPGWLKALLIVAVVIVVLVLGTIGAGVYWWAKNKDALNANGPVRLATKEALAVSYSKALSDLCPPQVSPEVAKQLGIPVFPSSHPEIDENGNGYTLLMACGTFTKYTLETSEPVKNRVAQWIESHHNELVNAKITRVGVKSVYPDIDDGSAWLDVR